MKESDHNVMIMEIISNWSTNFDDRSDRVEVYNYRNKDDFEEFKNVTENNKELRECFKDNNEDLETSSRRWLSLVNKNVKNCFKRIRISKTKVNSELEELFEKKGALKAVLAQTDDDCPSKEKTKDEIEDVEDKIANIIAKKNKETTEEYLSVMKDPLDGFNQAGTWSLKKKLAPKNCQEPPMAKKDSHGNLIADKTQLGKLYLETYINRLKPNDITPGL